MLFLCIDGQVLLLLESEVKRLDNLWFVQCLWYLLCVKNMMCFKQLIAKCASM